MIDARNVVKHIQNSSHSMSYRIGKSFGPSIRPKAAEKFGHANIRIDIIQRIVNRINL